MPFFKNFFILFFFFLNKILRGTDSNIWKQHSNIPVWVGTGIFWFLVKPFPLKSERLVAGFSNGFRPTPKGSLGGGLKGGTAVDTGGSVGFCKELKWKILRFLYCHQKSLLTRAFQFY